MTRSIRVHAGLAAALCAGLLLAGCASGGGGGNGEAAPAAGALPATEAAVIGQPDDPREPRSGGNLAFAGYSMPSSLDPTKTQATGPTGGTEMASIYGLLVRYDDAENAYAPQLAASLEESEDRLAWTLGLRDGVTFSDGTPLDAAAVIASIERYNAKGGANSGQFTAGVTGMEAPDPRTVVFHMAHPWREFPALLTYGHGMIVAPAGYGDAENFTPIGAGPFVVDDFAPATSLTVTARADYWDGAPYLSSVKFVDIAGDQPRLDALRTGGVQMVFLRGGEQIAAAKEDFGGYIFPLSLMDIVQINNRDARPGADVHVRKAIALALDPESFVERAQAGVGSPGKALFQDWSEWHTDVTPLPTDADAARAELEQAKADGFDGHLVYLGLNSPSSHNAAVWAQSMLEAVGFDVEIQYASSVTDLVQRMYVDHDFDITYGGNGTTDAAPVFRLDAALNSTSKNNLLGYSSSEMDGLLEQAQQAGNDDELCAVLGRIQQKVNDDVPFVPLGAGAEFVAWTDDVYGAVPSPDGIMLLGNAWIG
ncbi:ABC transporter substrate-binding protein [Tomitella gaofuii]|uniref:ABC transporter substrate-binding protein n=1 Tax=Tomitella gaofuii TaxID=2760083 RepID=UPI0015F92522|nr:ABC transporter substrate-binding protein [Tomitella gaofuii]